jgi:selT/selW/selH-like putative selenoprotein
LAARIKAALGVDSQLVRSSGGVFEVTVDGATVHSKKATGQFPAEDAVVRDIAKMGGR